jgi:hypothetical protein
MLCDPYPIVCLVWCLGVAILRLVLVGLHFPEVDFSLLPLVAEPFIGLVQEQSAVAEHLVRVECDQALKWVDFSHFEKEASRCGAKAAGFLAGLFL